MKHKGAKLFIRIAIVVMPLINAVGCSSAHEKIPEPDQSMRDVYDAQMLGPQQSGVVPDRLAGQRSVPYTSDVDLSLYTRDARNEVEQLFPRLPNPDLLMYVKPHFAGNLPVPGYTTVFKMYEVDHMAMPGEAD